MARRLQVDWTQPVSPDAPLNRGLVSWWMAGENPYWGGPKFLDLCGKNHGTLTNGPTWSGNSNCGGRGSIHCESGSSQYVSSGTELIGLSGAAKVTIGGWFYRTASSEPLAFLRNDTTASAVRFGISQFSDGNVYFIADGFGGGAFVGYSDDSVGWNRFDMVFDGSLGAGSSVIPYINGSPVIGSFSGLLPTVVGSSTNPIVLNITNATVYGTGNYNDCSIHLRAFSANEIRQRYFASLRGYPDELNYYRRQYIFDVGAGGGGGGAAMARHYYELAGGY